MLIFNYKQEDGSFDHTVACSVNLGAQCDCGFDGALEQLRLIHDAKHVPVEKEVEVYVEEAEKPILVTEDLVGHTIVSYELTDDTLQFNLENGNQVLYYHEQDCCEGVWIEDIAGELDDLIGSPLLIAEEVCSYDSLDVDREDHDDSFTWTFYKFYTVKGSVTIRWLGTSNGYYSESVDMKVW